MTNTLNTLVTGGAGFIGSHVIDRLLLEGQRVICIDNFNDYYNPKYKESNIAACLTNPQFVLYRGDICDVDFLKQVFSRENIDNIIHLAAKAGIRSSIQSPLTYIDANIKGTNNILEMARRFGISKIVFASSSSVYGNTQKLPFTETDNTASPISPYAVTKIAGEHLCYTYHHLYNLNIICLRFFTVYGPRGRPDMAVYKFFKLISEGRQIDVYGDSQSKRDYTYIDDIISGIMAAVDKELGYEIINLGNSTPVELQQLIAIIEETTGKKAMINAIEGQPGDVSITYASLAKAKRLLNFCPEISLQEGIKRFASWFNTVKDSRKEE